ncbi:hypothetical protein CVS27_11155 [Arthrobacter glacialis]|uniref:Gamma-glutamylcyclotransferase n=2 Tax=Arthrobacter glacialis TaxID=1664 RepID=A0A2S3ZX45_ARTGL|nr:hypothetical protein CVS27_11155 [Arthrobacter glacialis]
MGPAERAVRDYVNLESPQEDQVTLVQKVQSKRIQGRVHDVFDVHCTETRWWVITEPMNLYLQNDFPNAQQALIFHIGLGDFLAERSRMEIDGEHEKHISAAWRRFRDALETMNSASESEDFQSVGIKCRDSLIALVKAHQADPWVGEVAEPPKVADFKGWANIFADRLTEDRLRSYVKALVDRTWDLTVWLQHYSNATPMEADLVLEATSHLITTFGKLIHRQEMGSPSRCPRCESYRLHNELKHDVDANTYQESDVCAGCGWRSDWVAVHEFISE